MDIAKVKGVGKVLAAKFSDLGIFTAEDIIKTIPKSYVDMDAAFSLSDCIDGDFCGFTGEIVEIGRPYKKGKISILHGKAMCENREIRLIFYNQNYYARH